MQEIFTNACIISHQGGRIVVRENWKFKKKIKIKEISTNIECVCYRLFDVFLISLKQLT